MDDKERDKIEAGWMGHIIGLVFTGCIIGILVAVTVRIIRWIIGF